MHQPLRLPYRKSFLSMSKSFLPFLLSLPYPEPILISLSSICPSTSCKISSHFSPFSDISDQIIVAFVHTVL